MHRSYLLGSFRLSAVIDASVLVRRKVAGPGKNFELVKQYVISWLRLCVLSNFSALTRSIFLLDNAYRLTILRYGHATRQCQNEPTSGCRPLRVCGLCCLGCTILEDLQG
jgi:hypothetical protein